MKTAFIALVLVSIAVFRTQGQQDTRRPCEPEMWGCPFILAPVCGSDNKTYDNSCLLSYEQHCNPDLTQIDDFCCANDFSVCEGMIVPIDEKFRVS